MSDDLRDLGWTDTFAQHFTPYQEKGFVAGRIVRADRGRFQVLAEGGECAARLSGHYRHACQRMSEMPAVGDWVALRVPPGEGEARIQACLPRTSCFSRKANLAGGPQYRLGHVEEQVLAANIDTVFLLTGLDGNFNVRRIERYLAIAWDSGARPVVVLNKADLCADAAAAVAAVEPSAAGAPILVVSALDGTGLDALHPHLGAGRTIVFLGSSGVGKSTLINALLGAQRQSTRAVRESDSRGRHVTTAREVILLPDGTILIDTPGIRTLQPWEDEEGVSRVFADIEELAGQCRFRNCRHGTEPGCAIRQALEAGTLDPQRYANYVRLQGEQQVLTLRQQQRIRIAARRRRRLKGMPE